MCADKFCLSHREHTCTPARHALECDSKLLNQLISRSEIFGPKCTTHCCTKPTYNLEPCFPYQKAISPIINCPKLSLHHLKHIHTSDVCSIENFDVSGVYPNQKDANPMRQDLWSDETNAITHMLNLHF